ncbi:hypothetical protein FB561_3031 [Kribbella amoyensis]|uniref:Uncharacterized protein n=1 Tax=Kribbella amoyensis TaxID=996641 RepID=A0A561BSP7_9ACTN|nr:hypothetical protein [Kribbella amoyensis]TWD81907.1 hypothetical protein FB561_3031 [Kribbella amoyensis]
MKLERKHALVLIGVAVWNVVTYATFIKNLAATEGRPTGYYVAHTVLIVVNLGIAGVLGSWGVKAYRANRAVGSEPAPKADLNA